MIRPILIFSTLWFLLGNHAAIAHDLWIELDDYSPAVGTDIGVSILSGDNFKGEPVTLVPEQVKKFYVASAKDPPTQYDIKLTAKDTPTGSVKLKEEGLYNVVYLSSYFQIKMTKAKFNAYLKHVGLDEILALKPIPKNPNLPFIIERYSRYSKSFLVVGAADVSKDFSTIFGLPLELRFLSSPLTKNASSSVQLLFNGKPLQGVLLVAQNSNTSSDRQTKRSDNQGQVKFDLSAKGLWLITALYMQQAPKEAEYDWESFWASLTFEQ